MKTEVIKFENNSEEFTKWFGNSKAVNDKGEPWIVYRRDDQDTNNFDSKTEGVLGEGFYFSADKFFASEFTEKTNEFFLKIENPLYVERHKNNSPITDVLDAIEDQADKGIREIVYSEFYGQDIYENFIKGKTRSEINKIESNRLEGDIPSISKFINEVLERDGFDGVIKTRKGLEEAPREIMVLNSSQIKLAKNINVHESSDLNVMETILHHKDENFDIWIGCDQKRTLVEAYAKVDGGIRNLVWNYEPELANKIKSQGSLSALEEIKNDTIRDGVFSRRPYKLAQACDGSTTECALALFYNWCKSNKENPDLLYKKAYPEREAYHYPAWQECVSFAEWQGVKYPSLWNKKNVEGMLESLTEVNYHSLRNEVESYLEKQLVKKTRVKI